MDRKTCSLKLVADELLGGIKLDSFEDRLSLQKTIYLTQVCGIDLGYRYSWYVHGPYSPDLAETAFGYKSRKSHFDELAHKFKLVDTARKSLETTKVLIEPPEEMSAEPHRWRELLASIHYLRHIASFRDGEGTDEDNIDERLVVFGKRDFSREQVREAWDRLNREGLIDNKTLQ